MTPQTAAYLRAHRSDTPADLLAALAADVTTARNILTDHLSGYLTTISTGLFGVFLAYRAGTLPAPYEPLRMAFAQLDYILTNLRGVVQDGELVGGYVRTTGQEIALQMEAMLAGLRQAGLLSEQDANGFRALGGGYALDKDLTEEDLTDFLAALDAEDAAAAEAEAAHALRVRCANAFNATVTLVEGGETDWDLLAARFAAEPAEGG